MKRKRRTQNLMSDAPGVWSVTQIARLLRLLFYIIFRIIFDGVVMIIFGIVKLLALILFKLTGKAVGNLDFRGYISKLVNQFNSK